MNNVKETAMVRSPKRSGDFELPFVFIPDGAAGDAVPLPSPDPVRLRARLESKPNPVRAAVAPDQGHIADRPPGAARSDRQAGGAWARGAEPASGDADEA